MNPIGYYKKSVTMNLIRISYNESHRELVITNPIGKFQKKISYNKSYKESVITNSIGPVRTSPEPGPN
ncbi:hypothetical protein RhiirB3_443141 [Rhizophagus irregularis]|nr:hypothetical protein RhiirB3_443141 [Rhizophagus irregularis]